MASLLLGLLATTGCRGGGDGAGEPVEPAIEEPVEGDESGDESAELLPGAAVTDDIFAETEGDDASTQEGLRTLPVTVYQRAPRERLALTYVDARIVWFDSPVERGRQLVQHVLDGVPDSIGLPPGPSETRYREVYLDDRGVMWVDIPGSVAVRIEGSDQEQALVACLALTLTRNMEEVRRVGLLVDGEARTTLAGHVDLGRVYSGLEWRKALVVPSDLEGEGSVAGAAP